MTVPSFTIPKEPDLTPVLQIHRGHNDWVSLHRFHPDTGKFENLQSVRANDLEQAWLPMREILERDSFYSINAYYRGGRGKSKYAPDGMELPTANRRTEDLQWLTGCFADIDCHNLGVTAGQAIGAVIDAQDRGDVPPASMITRSGRGIWVFWLLRDDQEPDKPVRAWPEKVRLYANIQRAIGDRFATIGSDANARDPARVTRIPGSINTKSATRVDYWIQAGTDGKAFTYRIGDLARRFEALPLPARTKTLEQRLPEMQKRGRSGWKKRWLRARQNFEILWESRGGFGPGTRNAAVFLYVTFLRGLRLDPAAVTAEAWRLFDDLAQPANDPFSNTDMAAAIKGAKGCHNVANQTISDRLQVTADESELLEGWPPAAGQKLKPATWANLPRPARTKKRREILQARISADGLGEGLRELAEWLTDSGCSCTFKTVANDLEALGIKNPRRFQREKPAEGPSLFEVSPEKTPEIGV